MASKLVLLCGYYGFGNGGDEALLATLLQMLPPDITPVVMTATPASTASQHQVATCDRNNLLQVLPIMLKAKGFVWGGGSLIQDSSSWVSPLFYIFWMSLAQILRLKTVAWAQGIGPLHRPAIRTVAQRSFNACTARSVRDHASAALLNQWKLSYRLAPDPVWALQATPIETPPQSNVLQVAVVLRQHPLLTSERLSSLIQALVYLQQKSSVRLLLLPFQRSQDYDIALSIRDQLIEEADLLMLEDPRQLKGVFQSVDLTIAMRLHALIMAAAEGCRCFALSYDPKVSQLMEDLALPGYELAHLPQQPEVMASDWQKTLKAPPTFNQETISDRIQRSQIHQQLLTEVFS